MELEVIVSGGDLFDQLVELDDSPLVDGHELARVDHILPGVEVEEVAEDIARGVADLAVSLAHLL